LALGERRPRRSPTGGKHAVLGPGFLVVALVAGAFGFFGIAGTAAYIAKVLFFVFIVIFVVSLLTGMGRRRRL